MILQDVLKMFILIIINCLGLHHCRPVNGIQGFSRETTTALIANIESTEWIRRQRVHSNLNPEHPHASTTDDVECFFLRHERHSGQVLYPKEGTG